MSTPIWTTVEQLHGDGWCLDLDNRGLAGSPRFWTARFTNWRESRDGRTPVVVSERADPETAIVAAAELAEAFDLARFRADPPHFRPSL